MQQMRKVFIVGGCNATKQLFITRGWRIVDNVGVADLVCFTGGADVDPALYEHPRHTTTYPDPMRDQKEMAIFEAAAQKATPMVGICRGGQFLNVMNGGKMYQDCTGHTRSHELRVGNPTLPSGKFLVTSTHHQMMMPAKDGQILATGAPTSATFWHDEDNQWRTVEMEHGIEVVMYDLALCFQPHPEFGLLDANYEGMRNYFFRCIKELMADE